LIYWRSFDQQRALHSLNTHTHTHTYTHTERNSQKVDISGLESHLFSLHRDSVSWRQGRHEPGP